MDLVFSVVETALSPDQLIPALNGVLILLLASLAGLLFYGYLMDRAVFEGLGRVHAERFGLVDCLLAFLLVVFFSLNVLAALKAAKAEIASELPDAQLLVENMVLQVVVYLVFAAIILGALRLRRISWRDVFGLTRISFSGILWRAALLLLLAFPLIAVAHSLSAIILSIGNEDDNAQMLVRFFAQTNSARAKWAVAIDAIVVAPLAEEFFFRGYIYGVARRYGGVAPGVLFNAVLFAAIHTNLPSFAPLFVLAVCLTLAYEWTGSIWVPICMHALFNATTVVNLLLVGKDF